MVTRMATASTPWGTATVVEQLVLPQRAGEKRFSSIVQLLESTKGERLIRFAYATDGTARRGPVTLRASDVERLHVALERVPSLRAALLEGAPAPPPGRRGATRGATRQP